MSEDILRVAVEDRFIILNLREDKAMLPTNWKLLDHLSFALNSLNDYDLLFDSRELEYITSDVIDILDIMSSNTSSKILVSSQETNFIANQTHFEYFHELPKTIRDLPIFPIKNSPKTLNYIPLDLDYFTELDFDELLDKFDVIDVTEEYDADVFDELIDNERVNYLREFIAENGRNSLLNEIIIQENRGKVYLTPYHSHALYPIEAKNEIILGKPGVIAHKTGALFETEVTQLQSLLSQPKVKEAEIQKFLEKYPTILKLLGTNYSHIYPQIILERENGTSLRPDFILQPSDNGWCDILDIKLPDETIVVGGRDRKRFSSAVEELIAQLREYAAYFENPRLAKRIEEIYGIKCYRPRMIGVIGKTPRIADERQLRRLETSYADVSIITFDRLLEIAKTRILI